MSGDAVSNNHEVNDLNYIKIGTKRNDLKTDNQRSIFDAVDQNHDGKITANEYKDVVTGRIKNKAGKFIEKQYIKIKDIEKGRSIVVDDKGKTFIMSHDGIILKSTYVVSQIAKENLQKAQKSFKAQKAKDGWAGKTADAISALWGSDNRASVVSKDLEKHSRMIAQLVKSANTNSAEFAKKFKETFGVDFNETAVTEYLSNPCEETYEKAFGNKNNVRKRVEEYNQSQETGAAVVKMGAKIAATGAAATVIVATGGTAGVLVTAGLAAASSAAVDTSDRLTAEQDMTLEDVGDITKEAVIDGVTIGAVGKIAKAANIAIQGSSMATRIVRGGVKILGSAGVGAGAEYAQTGEVTPTGVAINTVVGTLGIAAEEGAFREAGKIVKKVLQSTDKVEHKASSTLVASNGKRYRIVTPKEMQGIRAAQAGRLATTHGPSGTVIKTDGMIIRIKNRPKTSQTARRQQPQSGAVGQRTTTSKSPQGQQTPTNTQMAQTRSAAPKTASQKPAQMRSAAPKTAPKTVPPEPRQTPATAQPKPRTTNAATQKQPVAPKVNAPKSSEEISNEMEAISVQLRAQRNGVKSQYQPKIQELEAKRTDMQAMLAEKEQAYYSSSAQQNENISRLSRISTNAKTQLSSLQTSCSNLEQQVLRTRAALRDMEKQLSDFQSSGGQRGSSVGELWKHAETKPKKFIGAEMKENINQKVVPDNPPSYYYDDEIADIYHSYNITAAKNKPSVVASLRERLSELENEFQKTQVRLNQQQELVNVSEQNLCDAYSAQRTSDSEFNTFKQQCRTDIESLGSQIEDSNAAMSRALQELKESPAYKTLSDTWTNLQKQLRELSN